MLTGKPPFSDGTLAQRIAKHQSEMPTAVRELRPDCPGELEGICVKMIQKDPAYRYQSAGDIAAVLGRFASAVPKGEKISIGLGEQPEFTDEESSSLSFVDRVRGSGVNGDTISNKNDDTLARSREKVVRGSGISASDSGRLVSVEKNKVPVEFFDGSCLDLEIESGYKGGAADRTPGLASALSQKSSAKSSANASRSEVGLDSDSLIGRGSNLSSRNQQKSGLDPMLVGAVVTALFIVALAIGYFLAKVTA